LTPGLLAAIALGVAVRLIWTYPVHKYAPDGDALLTGAQALQILRGATPVFYTPRRMGSVESYLHALVFLFVEPSRFAITLVPLAMGIGIVVVFALLCLELFDSRVAVAATFVMAVPSPAFLFWTYMPNGYPGTLFFGLLALWLAARIARRGATPGAALVFGLVLGIGWWNCLLGVAFSAPAVVWLAVRRPDLFRRAALIGPAILAGLAGATPWIAYNVVHPLDSFNDPYASRLVPGAGALRDNVGYFVGTRLPDLLWQYNPLAASVPANGLQAALSLPAIAILVASLLLFALLPLLDRRVLPDADDVRLRRGWWLLAGVAAVTIVLNTVTGGGGLRDHSVRYALPLMVVAAVAVALLALSLARGRRLVAAAVIAIPLLYDAAGYPLVWSPFRRELALEPAREEVLLAELEARGVTAVVGDFWLVYPYNFVSRERLHGVPIEAAADFLGVGALAARAPQGWALASRNAAELRGWADRAGLEGTIEEIGGVPVLVPDRAPGVEPGPPTAAFLQDLRASFAPGAPGG